MRLKTNRASRYDRTYWAFKLSTKTFDLESHEECSRRDCHESHAFQIGQQRLRLGYVQPESSCMKDCCRMTLSPTGCKHLAILVIYDSSSRPLILLSRAQTSRSSVSRLRRISKGSFYGRNRSHLVAVIQVYLKSSCRNPYHLQRYPMFDQELHTHAPLCPLVPTKPTSCSAHPTFNPGTPFSIATITSVLNSVKKLSTFVLTSSFKLLVSPCRSLIFFSNILVFCSSTLTLSFALAASSLRFDSIAAVLCPTGGPREGFEPFWRRQLILLMRCSRFCSLEGSCRR